MAAGGIDKHEGDDNRGKRSGPITVNPKGETPPDEINPALNPNMLRVLEYCLLTSGIIQGSGTTPFYIWWPYTNSTNSNGRTIAEVKAGFIWVTLGDDQTGNRVLVMSGYTLATMYNPQRNFTPEFRVVMNDEQGNSLYSDDWPIPGACPVKTTEINICKLLKGDLPPDNLAELIRRGCDAGQSFVEITSCEYIDC